MWGVLARGSGTWSPAGRCAWTQGGTWLGERLRFTTLDKLHAAASAGAHVGVPTRVADLLSSVGPAVEQAHATVARLEGQLLDPHLWDDARRGARVSAQHHSSSQLVATHAAIREEADAAVEMMTEARAEGDADLAAECEGVLAALVPRLQALLVATALTSREDHASCVMEIHAGAGGADSFDWAAMLGRMYTAWASSRGLTVDELEVVHSGTPGGVRRLSLRLDGPLAYGYLKAEAGVHRLVRISPFDAAKRRHTSFARVCCFATEEGERDEPGYAGATFDMRDVTIDTFRASGPGGQHVNTTDSAVRVVHTPTGITAVCQNERSQRRNKEAALTVLQAKLRAQWLVERGKAHDAVVASVGPNEWGSQIRSYVLHPYRVVKDHRTQGEFHDPGAMLHSGAGLTTFMEAALPLLR